MASKVLSADVTSRQEKSLGLLTAKFVSLLQEAKDGILDIKIVSLPDYFMLNYLELTSF